MTASLAAEFSAVYLTLREDVDAFCKPVDDSSSQRYLYSDPASLSQIERRAVVRGVFAFAEATTYFLRQQLATDFADVLGSDTLLALKEQQVSVSSSGEVRTTVLRAGALNYVRLTFNVYRQILPQAQIPMCAGAEFEALVAAVGVRDRLMHPKAVASLQVSDDEIRGVMRGFLWLNGATHSVLSAHVAALRESVQATKAKMLPGPSGGA